MKQAFSRACSGVDSHFRGNDAAAGFWSPAFIVIPAKAGIQFLVYIFPCLRQQGHLATACRQMAHGVHRPSAPGKMPEKTPQLHRKGGCPRLGNATNYELRQPRSFSVLGCPVQSIHQTGWNSLDRCARRTHPFSSEQFLELFFCGLAFLREILFLENVRKTVFTEGWRERRRCGR